MEALSRQIQEILTEQQQAEYEEIDALRVRGIEEADRAYRKIFMGAVPYSPEYGTLATPIIFWRLSIKRCMGGKVKSKYYRWLEK
jgi:hypothetical protein